MVEKMIKLSFSENKGLWFQPAFLKEELPATLFQGAAWKRK